MPFAFAAAAASVAGGAMSADASKSAAGTQANAANNATNLQQRTLAQSQSNLAPWLNSGQMSLAQLSRFAGLPGFSADPASQAVNFKGQQFDSMDALHQALYDDYVSKAGAWNVSEPAIKQAMSVATPVMSGGGNDPMFGAGLKPFGMADFQASPAYQFNLAEGEKAINKSAAARGNYYAPQTLQDIGKYSQGVASNEFQNAFSNYNTSMGNIWNRLSTLSGSGQNAAVSQGTNATQVAGQMGNNIIGAGNAQAAGQVGSANAINSGVGSAYNNYLMSQILAGNQQSSVPQVQEMVPGQFSTVNPQYGGGP